jgi:non-ribosomal peptide synthase protein (TIGR01720 family)
VLLREKNGGDGRLVAYVVGQQEALPEQASLRNYLEIVLPDYMIPSAFVFLPALPLTPNRKTDRQALLNMDLTVQSVVSYQPPSTKNQKALASIWKDMLRLERVGIHDSFFDLGGDSLLSIQMVSRARQAGVSLMPRQVFQYKTIEALAAIAESSIVQELEQEVISGEVPLTPIQHWFFSNDFPNPSFWTHSLLMELKQPMDGALLEAAAASLVTHHDGLRMRFTKENEGWRQVNLPEMTRSPFQKIDLSHIAPSAQRESLEDIAKAVEWIAVEGGVLFHTILFDLGEGRPGYLLIVTHHLVADGLSWRILLEDLQTAYLQLSEGKKIILPKKTTSFQRWSQALLEYAESDQIREEADFWKGWLSSGSTSFPVEDACGSRREAASETLYFNLSVEETRQLVQQAPVLWQCGIDDLLLTALTLTLNRWSGISRVLVDRDQHGREHFLDGIDVSRTVGWFTSLSPVLLEVHSESTLAQVLLSVRKQLGKIPYKGFHYGLLRYLAPESLIARELKKLPSAQLIFNYLGQVDQIFSDSSFFVMAENRIRRGFDPSWERPYEMAIDTYVLSSRFHLAWGYSSERYQRSTIEQLGQGFMKVLREFILPLAGGEEQDCMGKGGII